MTIVEARLENLEDCIDDYSYEESPEGQISISMVCGSDTVHIENTDNEDCYCVSINGENQDVVSLGKAFDRAEIAIKANHSEPTTISS